MALNFKIKIDADASSADKAVSSLYRLDAAIKNEGAALTALQSQLREMKKSGDAGGESFKKLSATIADQRNKVATLKDQMVDAGGMPKAAGKAASLDAILKSLSKNTGSLGKMLSALGPYGMAAAAALGAMGIAATATAGAIVYLGSKLIALGVQASEAKGDVTRSLELLYGGEKAAEHTYKVLESLTQDIAISQDRVMELADTLIKAGQVNGDAMVRSIAAIGKAEAARKGAGQVIEGVITRSQQSRMFSVSRSELMQVGLSYRELAKEISKGTGMAVGDAELRLRTGGVQLKAGLNALTSVIDSKMGDLANKKLMTVSVQSDRLRSNFAKLFEGVNAGPFARVLNMIANQLTESSVSGAALRTMLKSAFDELSAATERVMPYLQVFFEGAILLALKLYNALYPVRQAIAKLFGGADAGGLASFEDKTIAFADSLAKGFSVAAKAVAFLIAHIKELGQAVEVVTRLTPFVGNALDIGGGALKILTAGSSKVTDKARASGKNAADGVAAGITAGSPAVEKAMANMADKGLKAFDDKLQIQSPSKVMRLRGMYINQGLAKGVNDNNEPAKALSGVAADVAKAPIALSGEPSAKGANGGAPGAPTVVLHIHERAIVISGSNAQEIATALKDPLTELLADVLEKAAVMSGALEIKGAA